MLIVHAVPRGVDRERKRILEEIIQGLGSEYKFALAVPDGCLSEYKHLSDYAEIIEVKTSENDDNMLRDIYNYKRLYDKIRPAVVHSHGSVSANLGAFLSADKDTVSIKDYYASRMLRRVFEALSPRIRLSLTISYSPSDKQALYHGGVRSSSIIEVPYGVKSNARVLDCTERKTDTPLIIGSFDVGEECAILLSAFSIVSKGKNALFYLCGPDAFSDLAGHLASALGIGRRVVFFAPGSMPGECMSRADAFVLSSLDTDVCPIFALEEMSYSTAVVLPDTPRCRDLIRHGREGLIYSFGDSFSMADRITYLINYREECERMGKAAYMCAGEHSLCSMLDAFRSVYNSV